MERKRVAKNAIMIANWFQEFMRHFNKMCAKYIVKNKIIFCCGSESFPLNKMSGDINFILFSFKFGKGLNIHT